MASSGADISDSLTANPTLRIALDTEHRPLPGWKVRARPADAQGRPSWEVVHDGQAAPLFLGFFRDYAGYGTPHTRGLARTASAPDSLPFDPVDWTEVGAWAELLFPTAWAESNANFCVLNAWDRAAMTFGFIQLAAHTGEDLLPLFRRLVVELPGETRQWFPELGVVGGKLCFMKEGRYRSLEEPSAAWDGGFSANYYRGDLMGFFNPDRYHQSKPADPEELHAGARWLAWTILSRPMRAVQVRASVANLKDSVHKLHRAILAAPSLKTEYPKGVDGMRCDLLAVAAAALHLADKHAATIVAALATKNPIETIRTSGYGPGGRAQNVHHGMTKRPVLKTLFYDLASQQPV